MAAYLGREIAQNTLFCKAFRTIPDIAIKGNGGDGGIRTLDRALQPYNGLANRRLQPLGHVSGGCFLTDRRVEVNTLQHDGGAFAL